MASERLGYIPHCRRATGVGIDRTIAALIDEIDHPMAVGWEPGCDGRPDERRNGWLNGLQGGRGAALHECFDVRNAAVVGELGKQLPVGSVDRENGDATSDA